MNIATTKLLRVGESDVWIIPPRIIPFLRDGWMARIFQGFRWTLLMELYNRSSTPSQTSYHQVPFLPALISLLLRYSCRNPAPAPDLQQSPWRRYITCWIPSFRGCCETHWPKAVAFLSLGHDSVPLLSTGVPWRVSVAAPFSYIKSLPIVYRHRHGRR